MVPITGWGIDPKLRFQDLGFEFRVRAEGFSVEGRDLFTSGGR